MTLLDQIIDAATDSSASVPDLLRRVQVVARRVGAAQVEEWVRSELHGYPEDATLPAYRVIGAAALGYFTGPGGSSARIQLTARPKSMQDYWTVNLRQSVQELVSLANLDEDPGFEWPNSAVSQYVESGVFGLQWMNLFSVRAMMSRASLHGVTDSIRSKAMEFALDIQADYPDAGERGGPTVIAQPHLQQVVNNFTTTNNISGDGANIAVGHGIKQRSRVQIGDDAALRRGAEDLGLDAEVIEEFVSLVREEHAPDGPRLRSFLARVRDGAVSLSGAVTTEVAVNTLTDLVNGYLGQ